MSTATADVSPQKKAGQKKSKKISMEGISSPIHTNHTSEVTSPSKLNHEQLESLQGTSSENKRENESIKEISK